MKDLRKLILKIFQFITNIIPNVLIIWSEVLTRYNWRTSHDNVAMERRSKRVNSFAGKLAIKAGGSYIMHPG